MRFADAVLASATGLMTRSLGQEWGVVTDCEDPERRGRVRVRAAWHRPGQQTDWIERLGGGGNGYGESGGVPQAGELVALHFAQGNQHQPLYTQASWTPGGRGPLGSVPATLPPELETQPAHRPEDGKFKVWFWRSLAGFLLRVGEGLDWLTFRSPKGYALDLEHDVPVGGMDKDAAVTPSPYHRLRLTTPSGHTLLFHEHDPGDRNDVTLTHRSGMRVELKEKPLSQERTVTVALDGLTLEIRKKPGVAYLDLRDEAGQRVKLDAVATTLTLVSPGVVQVDAPSVLLGSAGDYRPVARLGDAVTASGTDSRSDTVTVTGTITSASAKVHSS